MSTRLNAAREIEGERKYVQQNIELEENRLRQFRDACATHEATLQALCLAANVARVDDLPQAELQSQIKARLQNDLDRAAASLQQAGSRPVAQLRAELQDAEFTQVDEQDRSLKQQLGSLNTDLKAARVAEENARRVLEAVDSSDVAVAARQQMEKASASVASAMGPWLRSRLAHALLTEAKQRFSDRAQAPMLQSASRYFTRMTDGAFTALVCSDDANGKPVLLAQRANGSHVTVDGMSEGTIDQLYQALRLAALDIRRDSGLVLPVILDDVLMTSDDGRARHVLGALSASQKTIKCCCLPIIPTWWMWQPSACRPRRWKWSFDARGRQGMKFVTFHIAAITFVIACLLYSSY